jgi:SAM-dependent methyltransferase
MGQDAAGARGSRLDREEWTRFWERGTLTTFEGHFRENYDAEIRDYWWREFGRLADGAAIVDLATGNGAVALLAARYAREHGREFAITGVDSAAIDVARLRQAWPALAGDFDAIRLLGGTPLEDTGLPAASVDLLTSQYGFEYGDTAAGSREAARILRPGGRLAMILHHRDSAILVQAREGLRQVELCLEETRLVPLARRMTKLFRGLRPGRQAGSLNWSPGALKVRAELLAAAERLERHARQPEVRAADAGFIEFLLPSVMRLVEQSRTLQPAQLEAAWAGIEREVDTYRRRMVDLASAARDEGGMAGIRDQLAAAGLADVRLEAFSYGDRLLLGWALSAQKPLSG